MSNKATKSPSKVGPSFVLFLVVLAYRLVSRYERKRGIFSTGFPHNLGDKLGSAVTDCLKGCLFWQMWQMPLAAELSHIAAVIHLTGKIWMCRIFALMSLCCFSQTLHLFCWCDLYKLVILVTIQYTVNTLERDDTFHLPPPSVSKWYYCLCCCHKDNWIAFHFPQSVNWKCHNFILNFGTGKNCHKDVHCIVITVWIILLRCTNK